ncbi:tryptophan--tRNA ligase, mitochondrial [Tribolium castaneum]|uniref:Tryptophan--tRNA ligase, mitochondrial n=1 Tax=Tribolium castaneum TaxID=7070 RepID=D6WMA7_TRICA|nr:PREDICTED: tryptophan--tRNA ligase, mitochondrial [Tribolium castaneum]EFA03333.2 Tryptophan--tRNA ligase, mitochondrial-like Protein [Tribolium castaneum]|eukprot:XP_970123.1 PREDICTED: tryptophan--tRNA ligase, mitochondrial [Tribolium castaneum]
MISARFSHKFFKRINLNKFYSSSVPKFPRRIFSGIQPTGQIHLGNYLGAIAQWVKLQENNEDMILSIVDLHSITLPQDPKTLSKNILEMAATLLACGIDPSKVILFQQSMVPAHTHLSWCLGCICTMPRLAHLPAYKEKSANLKDIPLGLFVYPVLQAADILAYKATHVPVGEDQAQHIQLTQDLARMFNNRFGETFPTPHCIFPGSDFARLRSLRDPAKKMSKSDPDPKSRICLIDPPDEIVKKIKKSVTDFTSEVTYDPENRPGVANLISIHSFVTGKTVSQICDEAKNLNTGQYKLQVADAVVSHVAPIQKKISDLLHNQDFLLQVLESGAEKATEISEATLQEVKDKLGLQFKRKTVHKHKLNL